MSQGELVRVAVVLLLVATACNSGSTPAPPPAPASVVLDPMYDLSAVPRRPAMSDTNDSREYYNAGMASADTNASVASAAFFWASRLDPSWAEPYFGRWYVLRHAAPRAMSDSVRRVIDSLHTMALIHDPFVDDQVSLREVAGHHAATWFLAFAERRYDIASRELGTLIPRYPDAIEAYIYRAKAMYYLGQYDSAAAVLGEAIGRIDAKDTTRLLRAYVSRTLLRYAMGMAYERGHREPEARAEFQKALTENLGFYMAHLHLASEALGARDTATAIAEARIAVEIRPDDPVVQLFLGATLLNAGHAGEAIEHFRAAIANDPYYALPYYYMGQACESAHDTAGSIAGYRGYLSRAKRRDDLRESAEQALFLLVRH